MSVFAEGRGEHQMSFWCSTLFVGLSHDQNWNCKRNYPVDIHMKLEVFRALSPILARVRKNQITWNIPPLVTSSPMKRVYVRLMEDPLVNFNLTSLLLRLRYWNHVIPYNGLANFYVNIFSSMFNLGCL